MNVPLNSRFQISLDCNPTTGYCWQPEIPEGIVLLRQDYKSNNADKMLVGGGGQETFVFEAKKVGTHQVMLRYLRPWLKSEVAREECIPVFVHD